MIYRLDRDTTPAVRMAFKLYIAGRSGKPIADVLTSHGFGSRNDKPISKSSILNWFRVPFVYAGCGMWNVECGMWNVECGMFLIGREMIQARKSVASFILETNGS